MVPDWLLREAKAAIRADGTMAPADLALFTRAIVASPEALVTPSSVQETFQWVKRPDDGIAPGKWYVDGSRLDAEWDLSGMCARYGWAIAAFDEAGALAAAANGRPPAWATGIFGAELWGLLMASVSAEPGAPFRVDCLAVQQGAGRGSTWATAPDRKLARAWGPLAAALDGEPQRVVWMPAHCSHALVGIRTLSDGTPLSAIDVNANALVDRLAKAAARADRAPASQLAAVRTLGCRLTAIARWIGQVTVYAGSFPDPSWSGIGKLKRIRDTDAVTVGTVRHHPPKPVVAPSLFGAACPRWVALRQRIVAKEAARRIAAESG
jgi:hypothetical protein